MDATLSRLKTRDIPPVPSDILRSLRDRRVTLVPFEECVRVIFDPALRTENGVAEFGDGSFTASVSCPMHGVTPEMIQWWIWWFPQDVERFRVWLPDTNFEVTYSENDIDFFTADDVPPFRPVTLYPNQVVGEINLPFRIDLVMPEDFGITEEDIVKAGNPLVICGRMMARKGKLLISDFLYVVFPTEYGCLFSARLWVGRISSSLVQRLLFLNEKRVVGMAETCYRLFACLDGVLPELYTVRNK